jgi:hypothetical protein
MWDHMFSLWRINQMNLEEFKKQNEGQPETVEEQEKKPEVVTTEEETVVEPWMVSEDYAEPVEPEPEGEPDPEKKNDQIPLKKFLITKDKLKGTVTELTEKEKEIERLRLENEALKNQKPVAPKELKKPVAEDFKNDEDYQVAYENYLIDVAEDRFTRKEIKSTEEKRQEEFLNSLKTSVDTHYERAAKMIENSAIKPDVYQNADTLFRKTIDTVFPGDIEQNGKIVKQSEFISDNLIADIGEGSEKVVYFLGRNESARNKLQSLLLEDPRGIKAAIYLGKQNERLNNPKKAVSQAREPAAQLKGGAPKPTSSDQKSYSKLMKAGDVNSAFAIKRAAKISGVDTSAWE